MDQYDNDYSLENVIKVQVEKLRSQCRHFLGIQYGTCKAGVNFRRLAGGPDFVEKSKTSWPDRLPCQQRRKQEKGIRILCKKFEHFSEEEIEDQKKDLIQLMTFEAPLFKELCDKIRIKHAIGRTRLPELSSRNKGIIAGTMGCPKCQGSLVYEISGRNAIKIKCKTPDCIHMVEP